MKVLNRPMFRYGGPIKEGIMSGIKEPRQRYAKAGDVFKNVQASLQSGEAADPAVLNEAAKLGIGNPYKNYNYTTSSLFPKVIVPRPVDNTYANFDMAETTPSIIPSEDEVLQQKLTVIANKANKGKRLNNDDMELAETYGITYGRDLFNSENRGDIEDKNIKRATESLINEPYKSTSEIKQDELASGTIKPDVKLPGDNNDTPPPPPTKKEKINSILEGLGYDRAQKNALYDAMIKAGQRISRTGLGAENLVSDVIAETSQSYDKPEKLREAANLMQVQQDLKLDQIDASKDTRPPVQKLAEYYMSKEGGGLEQDVAIRKANKLPTTLGEYFTASAAKTDLGKVRDATNQATRDGLFGEGVVYRGKIEAKEYDGSLKKFVGSDDFKGDGVYNVGGKAIVIKNGEIVLEEIIQAKAEKTGLF